MSELEDALEERAQQFSPAAVPSFGGVLARRAVRRRTRRVAGVAALGAVAGLAVAPSLLGDEDRQSLTTPAPPATSVLEVNQLDPATDTAVEAGARRCAAEQSAVVAEGNSSPLHAPVLRVEVPEPQAGALARCLRDLPGSTTAELVPGGSQNATDHCSAINTALGLLVDRVTGWPPVEQQGVDLTTRVEALIADRQDVLPHHRAALDRIWAAINDLLLGDPRSRADVRLRQEHHALLRSCPAVPPSPTEEPVSAVLHRARLDGRTELLAVNPGRIVLRGTVDEDVTPADLPAQDVVLAVAARNGRMWLLTGDCARATASTWTTDDRGRTWRQFDGPGSPDCSAGSRTTLDVTGRSSATAVVAAYDTDLARTYATRDGGNTWQETGCRIPPAWRGG